MNNQMIVKIESSLDKLKQKPIKISQNGFIMNQFFYDLLPEFSTGYPMEMFSTISTGLLTEFIVK